MGNRLRWGIVGTGMIANKFAKALAGREGHVRKAAASRTAAKARAFAHTHGFEKAHASYEALFADRAVDAVYIATPHTLHIEPVIQAAEAGKHILCEKPLGVTPSECREMIDAADRNGVVLLEAFMYRTHPQTLLLKKLLSQGRIGAIRTIRSTFCFKLGADYNVRLDKSLRGGGLYDVGCYCINFSRMVTDEEPDAVHAVWDLGEDSGVDENLAAVLHFPCGAVATFNVAVGNAGGVAAEIVGDEGTLVVDRPWNPDPERATMQIRPNGKPPEEISVADGGNCFELEADHLAAVVAGREAPLIPAENAVGNAAVMDRIWQAMHGAP